MKVFTGRGNRVDGGQIVFQRGQGVVVLTVIVLAALILLSGIVVAPLPALAQEQVQVSIVDADGELILMDPPPVVVENRTLVPVAMLAEVLQAELEWEGEQLTVILTRGSDFMRIRVDNEQAKMNGQNLSLEVPPCIIGDRVYVPLRFVAEAFGATVGWDGATSTVTVAPSLESVSQ